MEKYFDILRKCILWDGIADSDVLSMLGCIGAEVRAYEKKETVIFEGDVAKNIGIVLRGSVHIEQTDYFGNRSIVSVIMPSELFGESFACADVDKIPVSVVAAEESEIMFVDCKRVLSSCSNSCVFHQRMIYNLLKTVAQKNILFHRKIEVTSKRTTREKLLTYLHICAKNAGSSTFVTPYDRQQLADYLAVDRSGLSVEISKLRKEKVITSEKNRFTLL